MILRDVIQKLLVYIKEMFVNKTIFDALFLLGNARAKRMYFVVFYGSTADFAWVYDAAVIPYKGVEAFTKYAQETVDKVLIESIIKNTFRCFFISLGTNKVSKRTINGTISVEGYNWST
jgi:hypothetical protein